MLVSCGLLFCLVFILSGFSTNLIPSTSMEPTLVPGDHALIMRAWLAYPFGVMPARGDIITFHPPKAVLDDEAATANDNSADASTEQPSSLITVPRKPKREILIKRVVGLPGDTVQIIGEIVYINGKPLKETYQITPNHDREGTYYPYAVRQPLKVEPGHLFVLGDNRSNSDDGRFWGTLDRKEVVGRYVRVLFHETAIAEAREDTSQDR